MDLRHESGEHPFGSIKQRIGQRDFLTRRIENVRGEFSLTALAYNKEIKDMVRVSSGKDAPYQRLFSSVALSAINDAIIDERRFGTGVDSIIRWAQSKDGSMVLRCAGIEPSQRCVEGIKAFVRAGASASIKQELNRPV